VTLICLTVILLDLLACCTDIVIKC